MAPPIAPALTLAIWVWEQLGDCYKIYYFSKTFTYEIKTILKNVSLNKVLF